jgi:predicted enzyme related to lactoylglutathione lyase
MGQPVIHFEIGCRDRARTADFFSGLFGWNMQPMGPATMINTGAESGIHGHITGLGHEPYHYTIYTIFYIQVDDVQGYLDKAGSAVRRWCRRSRFRLEPSPGLPIRTVTRSDCGNRNKPGSK